MGHRRGWRMALAWTTAVAVVSVLPFVGTAWGTHQQVIADGSFEAGAFGGVWDESSTNYETPVCEPTFCSEGGARTGDNWVWFGGDASETAVVSQEVTIPAAGPAELSFFLAFPDCAGTGTHTFVAQIDGTDVFATDDQDPACGTLTYHHKTVDITTYADGAAHTVTFRVVIPPGEVFSSFYLDDVSVTLNPTDVTLLVRKTGTRIRARGTVDPPHPSESIAVTLLRKRQGSFRVVKTVVRELDAAGAYAAGFRRPRPGSCLIEVAFPADHASSTASKTFRC